MVSVGKTMRLRCSGTDSYGVTRMVPADSGVTGTVFTDSGVTGTVSGTTGADSWRQTDAAVRAALLDSKEQDLDSTKEEG